MENYDLVIVGGGPAGMAAALSAFDQGVRSICILEREPFLGGILNQCIHTGFGIDYFKEILTGPEYASRFIAAIEANPIIEVSLKTFVVQLSEGNILTCIKPGKLQQVQAKSIVMATGCRERTREMISIPGTRPAGVLTAGLAQKMINCEGLLPGKRVVIIGSGDIGLIMARRFILEGAIVEGIVEINSSTTGLLRNVVQCVEDYNIPIYFNHRVKKIYGTNRVEKIDICMVNEHGVEVENSIFSVVCDTVLLSVGLIPENELIEMVGAAIDKTTNTPIGNGVNLTSVPGLFVCGNAYKIYDYVDNVTRDSYKIGKIVASYLQGVNESE